MKKIAILGNATSSSITDRRELVDLLNKMDFIVYCGRIMDGKINSYYSEKTAQLLPISASRNNTNPINEIKSIVSVRNQIKNNKVDAVIIYGVKNHSAMAIGSWLGGAKKSLCVVNGSGNLFRLTGFKGIIIRFMAFPMLRIAYKHSTSICFQNKDDLELFKRKRLIKPNYDVFVTGGSGVNLESFPVASMPVDNRFLFLSRITPTKGLIEFCEAARIVKQKYPEAIFDIVGPLDSVIESCSIKGLLDKAVDDGIVNYHGYTSEVAEWMKKCRFFVYPSYYPEGIPRCVLQALSTGRPVITCNTPGCKETVINNKNGFIIEPRDPKLLAQKMTWMIRHPEETREMGFRSRILAENRFDVDKINVELLNHLMQGDLL